MDYESNKCGKFNVIKEIMTILRRKLGLLGHICRMGSCWKRKKRKTELGVDRKHCILVPDRGAWKNMVKVKWISVVFLVPELKEEKEKRSRECRGLLISTSMSTPYEIC